MAMQLLDVLPGSLGDCAPCSVGADAKHSGNFGIWPPSFIASHPHLDNLFGSHCRHSTGVSSRGPSMCVSVIRIFFLCSPNKIVEHVVSRVAIFMAAHKPALAWAYKCLKNKSMNALERCDIVFGERDTKPATRRFRPRSENSPDASAASRGDTFDSPKIRDFVESLEPYNWQPDFGIVGNNHDVLSMKECVVARAARCINTVAARSFYQSRDIGEMVE